MWRGFVVQVHRLQTFEKGYKSKDQFEMELERARGSIHIFTRIKLKLPVLNLILQKID